MSARASSTNTHLLRRVCVMPEKQRAQTPTTRPGSSSGGIARLNDEQCHPPPPKKEQHQDMSCWFDCHLFTKFSQILVTYFHIAGDSIGRVSRVSLPAGGAHQACRSLGQSLGRNPIGEPNLIPSFTLCRAEQRGEILGGQSKDTEVREAQVVWDVGV